jgi:hypothetical protein
MVNAQKNPMVCELSAHGSKFESDLSSSPLYPRALARENNVPE